MCAAKACRWLWRLNAVIIALAGTLAAVVLLFAAYHILNDLTRTRHASGMVNVEAEDSVAETWTYGTLRRIRGTDVAVLDLQSQQSYSLNFGSGKVAEATRNLLFIDTQTGSRRWLLGNNESAITQYEFLPREYDADSEAQPVALIVVRNSLIAVETHLTACPPHRSVHAPLRHTAPTLDE